MLRRLHIDWRTAAGFCGLLFLIVSIGVIGIRQIQGLSHAVTFLAKESMPAQNEIFEMKSTNSKYAMGMRSYMFWRSAKYLDAASMAQRLDFVRVSTENFDKNLKQYASRIVSPKESAWIKDLQFNEGKLRDIGHSVMALVDKAESLEGQDKKNNEEAISKLLMDFENRLFQIDAFLDDTLQKYNLNKIDTQLSVARRDGQRSVFFLFWAIFIGLGLGAQTIVFIYNRTKAEQANRELLWHKVVRLEEEERNNLSLQIHDQLGQDLSALKIYLGLIERDIAPEAAEQIEKIKKAKQILTTLMEKAHNISELLRPLELDDLGLVESLNALIESNKDMTSANYIYRAPLDELKLSSEYCLVLYRIVQEALTNVIKYSDAKNIEVVLDVKPDHVFLMVKDDGIGFDYESYMNQPGRRRDDKIRLGLKGLRERTELLGGNFRVFTKIGAGTKIEVELPLVNRVG